MSDPKFGRGPSAVYCSEHGWHYDAEECPECPPPTSIFLGQVVSVDPELGEVTIEALPDEE